MNDAPYALRPIEQGVKTIEVHHSKKIEMVPDDASMIKVFNAQSGRMAVITGVWVIDDGEIAADFGNVTHDLSAIVLENDQPKILQRIVGPVHYHRRGFEDIKPYGSKPVSRHYGFKDIHELVDFLRSKGR
jgi:hypothetical protein